MCCSSFSLACLLASLPSTQQWKSNACMISCILLAGTLAICAVQMHSNKLLYSRIEPAICCSQAPITFLLSQPTGQPGYVVTVRNKNWFSSTEGLIFSFRLLADGLPIKQEADEAWTEYDIAQIPPQVQLQPAAVSMVTMGPSA